VVGLTGLWIAILADTGATVLVTMNALRLLRFNPERKACDMISGFGWPALARLFGYLALFFCGSALAAQAAGRPIWLFAPARRRDRLAAAFFRADFVLAFFGSLLWPALPGLHKVDPL